MFENDLNKPWKKDFFEIFATQTGNQKKLEDADKIKIEHFPPVLGQYYPNNITEDKLHDLCNGKIKLSKVKTLDHYNSKILKTDYEKTIKTQLNSLMQKQIQKLETEDPNFLKDDEKNIIEEAEFPFIKLMTLVYSKDTNQMSKEDQQQWKEYMNQFITQQIVFVVVNTYYTMKFYQDNLYAATLQTPYNNEYVWNNYGYDGTGICVAYDFKEITEKTVENIRKIFPLFYVEKPYTKENLEEDIANMYCTSLFKVKETADKNDNEWSYFIHHQYTETEYAMLDNLLEPVYTYSMEHSKIQPLLNKNYLEINNGELTYNYNKLIDGLLEVLEQEEFLNPIKDKLTEIYNITPDTLEIEFMKPEAIYLGPDFTQEKIESFKEIIEKEDARVFKIKKSDDKLFKALI